MAHFIPNRRTVLKSMGISASALGMLPLFPSLAHSQNALPKRLVIMFTANGTVYPNWKPTGGENNFQLSPILEPLAAHKDDIVVLSDVACRSAQNGPGDDHQKGMGHILTGTELLAGDEFPGCGGECAGSGWGGGISVDQFIADRVGEATRFPSFPFGVQVQGNNIWTRMSYRRANEPIPPINSPYDTFDRLFAGLDQDPAQVQQAMLERRSVIDVLKGDLSRVQARIGRSQQRKLQAHLEAIRSIERRLQDVPVIGAACERPDLGPQIDINANDNFPAIGRLQMDLLAMSLACDLTRVATLQWSQSVSNTRFTWLSRPIHEGHHELSHEGDDNAEAIDKLTRINRWYAQQFAYLIGRLKGIPEGNGTVLDNTTIVWVNELAKGNRHSHSPMPFVLAGGGGFQTGRFLSRPGESHNKLLVSLCHAMGLDDVQTFGNANYGRGGMPGLS